MTSVLGNAISVVPLKENWVDFQALLEFKEGRIPSNIRQGGQDRRAVRANTAR
jgi:hypothetical protein